MVRTALSPAEVDEVWRRWRSGQAVKVLSREMRRHPVSLPRRLRRLLLHVRDRGGHEKGGVEGEVGRFRRNHLVPQPDVATLGELNARL
jgi:hypothetical protein